MKNHLLYTVGTLMIAATIYPGCNPCEDVSCINGGVCIEGTCECEDGYYGDQCEEYDACYRNPCQNGGSCNSVTTFCDCPGPYTGADCSQLYEDVLEGYWVRVVLSSIDTTVVNDHLMVIRRSGSRFSIENLTNRNGGFTGGISDGEFIVDEGSVYDEDCENDARVTGGEGKIKYSDNGYRFELKVAYYNRDCLGNFCGCLDISTMQFLKI